GFPRRARAGSTASTAPRRPRRPPPPDRIARIRACWGTLGRSWVRGKFIFWAFVARGHGASSGDDAAGYRAPSLEGISDGSRPSRPPALLGRRARPARAGGALAAAAAAVAPGVGARGRVSYALHRRVPAHDAAAAVVGCRHPATRPAVRKMAFVQVSVFGAINAITGR